MARRPWRILRGLSLAIGLVLSGRARAADFQIVVHTSNPVEALSKKQVADLFLKKTPVWETGEAVSPLDLAEDCAVRAQFSKQILGKSVGAVKSYWQQKIFSGRGIPPPEMASEKDALAYIRSHPGAVAYVSAVADPRGLRIVKITE